MPTNLIFTAPWSTSLVVVSISCFVLLSATSMLLFVKLRNESRLLALVAAVPFTILVVTALFSTRGYELANNCLLIQHFGWSSKIELSQLVDVKIDPKAMEKSSRVWGNGGLFSFSGNYRNSRLGAFQVYATDPSRAVVLRLAERTIVVTPSGPARFVQAVIEHQSV